MRRVFYKYQAGGNSFALLKSHEDKDWSSLARRVCHSQRTDGLIVVSPLEREIKIRIFNPDGSEAETSGNGIACSAWFAFEHKLASAKHIMIKTIAGVKEAFIKEGLVKVNMGPPIFQPSEIPVDIDLPPPILDYPLKIGVDVFKLSFVSMGNPHAVLFIEQSPQSFPLQKVGPRIENHPLFPKRINFEVAKICSENRVKARVWERGVGETSSCGSGACAIATISFIKKLTERNVEIEFKGGVVRVEVGEEIWLEVKAERVL